jgi:hypothetical protein
MRALQHGADVRGAAGKRAPRTTLYADQLPLNDCSHHVLPLLACVRCSNMARLSEAQLAKLLKGPPCVQLS